MWGLLPCMILLVVYAREYVLLHGKKESAADNLAIGTATRLHGLSAE